MENYLVVYNYLHNKSNKKVFVHLCQIFGFQQLLLLLKCLLYLINSNSFLGPLEQIKYLVMLIFIKTIIIDATITKDDWNQYRNLIFITVVSQKCIQLLDSI